MVRGDQLRQMGFELENPEEIIAFLDKNERAEVVLAETKNEVNKYFITNSLKLSLYKDYEEGYEVLNIIISSGLPADQLFEKEKFLFDNWFEPHYRNLDGKLTISVYPF